TQTHGYGIMNHTFEAHGPVVEGDVVGRRQGVLVGMEAGKASTYSILQLEDRGTIFVEPGTEIYAGMIVGEHNRENDLTVNITKEKLLTNMRSANKDQTSIVQKARDMSLEESIQYLDDDVYCEVTPKAIRLRKKLLDKNERAKAKKN